MSKFRTGLAGLVGCLLFAAVVVSARAADPIVVKAIDNDPTNKLWNCETNRVPFGNQQVDRSRCFTFRYTVPPGGITSATVHIALDTLGSLQDTDATIMAVGAPVEACAWGQASMPGCVMLHGGFKGGEKSLNLDLLNIACDASFPNTAENQVLVRQALESGVLHMELQDDTAVYSAELVLNADAPSFPCGTSEQAVSSFVPTVSSSSASSTSSNPLDSVFNPPQYLIHAVEHDTATGPVKDDRYLLYLLPPDNAGEVEFFDATGRTFTYRTDYSSGPYTTPRQVCAAEGARLRDTSLAAWNGGASFRCNEVAIAARTNNSALSALEKGATEFLTGTPSPTPPNPGGAATASVLGALALALLAGSNYLLSSSSFVQGALKSAMGRGATNDRGRTTEEKESRNKKQETRSEGAREAGASGAGEMGSAPSTREAGSNGAGEMGSTPTTREAGGAGEMSGTPSTRDAGTHGVGEMSGTPSARDASTATKGSAGMSGDTATTPLSAETRGATEAANAPATMSGTATSNVGSPPLTATGSAAGSAANTGTDLGAVALEKSVKEGISSVPDASELVKDKLVDKAEQRERRERLQEQLRRAKELVAAQQQTLDAASATLKRAVDGVGDYDAAFRAWKQAEYQVTQTQKQLDTLTRQLAVMDAKKEEGA